MSACSEAVVHGEAPQLHVQDRQPSGMHDRPKEQLHTTLPQQALIADQLVVDQQDAYDAPESHNSSLLTEQQAGVDSSANHATPAASSQPPQKLTQCNEATKIAGCKAGPTDLPTMRAQIRVLGVGEPNSDDASSTVAANSSTEVEKKTVACKQAQQRRQVLEDQSR